MNALKLILKERGITQTAFAKELCISKQSVTRWVSRQKPMHEDRIAYTEDFLGVKREYFVDERRYVKDLDINAKLELEDYLLRQRFEQPISTRSLYKQRNDLNESELARREYLDQKYSMHYRRKKIDADIQKLVGRFRKDIRYTDATINYFTTSQGYDCIENNISFYERLLHIREDKNVTEDEWNSIMKALYMLTTKESDIAVDEVTLGIYKILKDNRTKKEHVRQENVGFYKSVWEKNDK